MSHEMTTRSNDKLGYLSDKLSPASPSPSSPEPHLTDTTTVNDDVTLEVTKTQFSAPPAVPIELTWRNVTYSVEKPKTGKTSLLGKLKQRMAKKPTAPATTATISDAPTGETQRQQSDESVQYKHILADVSGYTLPGQLLAIMGASGSGKTSLLNVIAGRNKQYTGDVLFNGRKMNKRTQRQVSFIQQTDLFYKSLTVYEHLMFQAKLRLPKQTTVEDQHQAVSDVIAELGLVKITHTTIGQVGQGGISGGERRRLAVATELLTKPALLLLDEPTSGLDSFMAEEVVHTLKHLTQSGRTVVCTIHQPSSQLYALFDRVMYLAEGRVAYSGTVEAAVSYFDALHYKCPSYTNAADFIIKQLSTAPSHIEQSKAQINKILVAYDSSSNHHEALHVIDDVVARHGGSATPTHNNNSSDSPTNASKGIKQVEGDVGASWIRQFATLSHRSSLNIRRDPMLFRARMGQAVILGVLSGLIWLRLGDGQTSVQDRVGVLFFFILNQAMGNIMQMLTMFPLEMPVFAREYQSGLVRTDTYFLAKNISELPFQVLFPVIFSTISYWMVGLSDSATKWIEITALNVLTSQAALSLGYAVSAGSPSVQISLVLGPMLILPFMIFGGLLINTNSIPDYFYWLSYTSFVKYGYESMNIVLWKDTTISCNPGEICAYHTGDDVLRAYGWHDSDLGECIGVLFALAIGLRFFAWMLLWRRVQKAA